MKMKKNPQIRKPQKQMGAKAKIEEANYFLQELRRANQNVFHYYFSAFLSAWRSVLDVMLFDFAQMYSLGFDDNARINDEGFEIAARATKQREALRFITWWRQQRQRISKSPLYRARNNLVHRGVSPLTYSFPLVPDSSLPPPNSLVVKTLPVLVRFRKHGILLSGNAINGLKIPDTARKGIKSEFVFEDFPTRNAVDVCKEAFDKMNGIVNIATRRYWQPKKEKHSSGTRTTIQIVKEK